MTKSVVNDTRSAAAITPSAPDHRLSASSSGKRL
jgi:hypothetical protein